MTRSLRPALALATLSSLANAQYLEISEVLIQPQPGHPTAIELRTAHLPGDTSQHYLVINGTQVNLPAVIVPPSTSIVFLLGTSGPSLPYQFHLPTAPALTPAGSLALFEAAPPTPPQLVSYVTWGGYNDPMTAQAVTAGKWSSIAASAPLPLGIGSTLANRWQSRIGSPHHGPDAWYDDSTPTLGAANDPGWTYWYAEGCPGINGPTLGFPAAQPPAPPWDAGPWLGELYSIGIAPMPSPALLVLSLTPTPPIALDPIGVPGCYAHLTLETTAMFGTNGLWTFVPPPVQSIVGVELNMQAYVPDAAAQNPAQALVTIAIRATIGSR